MESQGMTGVELPRMVTTVPGPRSVAMVDDLARAECPAITARRARRTAETGVGQDPIVWAEGAGANIKDVDGNLYVDVTSGFAVMGLGHGHPAVRAAAHRQVDRLLHAMGDVYPSDAKIALSRRLSEVAPQGLEQSILGMSGADAIDAALKTAAVATGKPGVLAFWGGYHGLSYGALSVTAYRDSFRRPFLAQLNPHVRHVPYPDTYRPPLGLAPGTPPEEVGRACLAHVRQTLTHPAAGGGNIGAVLIEPIQARGGEIVPPAGFLPGLRALCDELGVLLIFDEIYTGFGRTGTMFACEHEGVVPDLICVGKAMGGGAALSAVIGKPEVMARWGTSSGEAVHTSTFLGNPLSCAMAEAALTELVEGGWAQKVAARGVEVEARLRGLQARWPEVIGDVRGRGLMWGLDLVKDVETRAPDGGLAIGLMDDCRREGYLWLPSGVDGNVLALTPPFVITPEQLDGALSGLEAALAVRAGQQK
jgi:4-aminobutyrate aminotransferase / (S)-3-amino-2-methylpropionate transaminase / 5-aminovalerate transaminase